MSGYWRLKSPLPGCPVGTKGEKWSYENPPDIPPDLSGPDILRTDALTDRFISDFIGALSEENLSDWNAWLLRMPPRDILKMNPAELKAAFAESKKGRPR